MTQLMNRSPLDHIPNLVPVPPEQVKKLEDHLATTVLPKVRKLLIEQREAAYKMRHKIIG